VSSPHRKKQKTSGRSIVSESNRVAHDFPTLSQVAEEARFASLRDLIEPVGEAPVNELNEELRGALKKHAGDKLELLLVSFFSACDARYKAVGESAQEDVREPPRTGLPLISRPSSVGEFEVSEFRRKTSVLVHSEAYWALQFLTNAEPLGEDNMPFITCAKEFLDELELLKRHKKPRGLFNYHIKNKGEISMSSSLAVHLQRHLSTSNGVDLWWYHQFEDPCDGKMDILLAAGNEMSDKTPYAIIEMGFQSNIKHWQLLAYGINMSRCLLALNQLYYIVEFKIDRNRNNDSITLRSILATSKGFVDESFIWECDVNVESLSKVFYVLVHCCLQSSNEFKMLGPNCSYCFKSKKVFKCFDYRNGHVEEQCKRLPILYHKFLDAKTEQNPVDNLIIISYDYIPGSHIPNRYADFVPVLRQLKRMHSELIVHGDIRLSNIVFCGGKSTLIDFDYSGTEEIKLYPKGFCTEIDDGNRHVDVRGGVALHRRHDFYAMATLMKLFSCDQDSWNDAIISVENGELDHAVSILEAGDQNIICLENSLEILLKRKGLATGSLPKVISARSEPHKAFIKPEN
jgi:serine/threonine protein kinase